MNEIVVKPGTEINLGKRGEHLARCVVFDISDWKKIYGEGRAHLLHQRNGDNAPYPCVVEMIDNKVLWTLNEVDLDVAGRGRAELQYFVGEARVKSETWFTRTDFAMNNEGPVPDEPAENWLDTMLELGTQTQDNAEAADDSAKAAQDSASAAAASAEAAKNSEEYTREIAEGVVAEAEQKILEHVTNAAASAESASEDSMSAKESAENAAASEEVAKEAEQAAKEAQEAAEKARDEASAIAGGDFATNAALKSHTDNKSNPHGVTAAQVGAVPTTRKVNGKALSADISLTAADVGAVNQLAVYYSGGKNVDDLTDPLALISLGATTNKELQDAVGGTFAYVMTLFYASVSTESRRMQIAWSYNANPHRMAFRIYAANGWQPWTRLADDSKVLYLDGSKPMTGALNFQAVDNGSGRVLKSHSATADYGTYLRDYDKTGAFVSLAVQAANNKASFVDKDGQTYNLYHTGNKPTAADVGAYPTQNRLRDVDLNTVLSRGVYQVDFTASSGNKVAYNSPTDDVTWMELFVSGNGVVAPGGRNVQIAYLPYNHHRKMFLRFSHDSNWSGWKEVATTDNALMRDGSNVMTGPLVVESNPNIPQYILLRVGSDSAVGIENVGKNGDGRHGLWVAPGSTDRTRALVLESIDAAGNFAVDYILHTGNYTNYALARDGSNAMMGSLKFDPSGDGKRRGYLYKSVVGNGDYGTQVHDVNSDGIDAYLTVRANSSDVVFQTLANGEYSQMHVMLHTGNRELVSKTLTATVTTNWTLSTNGYYYQTITVSGILATDNPIVDFVPSATDLSANLVYADCMSKVLWITTGDNQIVIRATEAISSAFPIQIKVVR